MATTKKTQPLTLGDVVSKISKLQTNQILYVLLLVAVFFLGYLIARVQLLESAKTITQAPNTQVPPGDPNAIPGPDEKINVAVGNLPAAGEENATVTIVEFSDFECPFCKRYFDETLGQIKAEYVDTGRVKMYFRHYPLDFHPAAIPAALASECANEQGAFWEYHDLVFEQQDRIVGGGDNANTALKDMATTLGLNAAQFNQCLDSAKYQANVDQDFAEGQAAGVSGTPTVFVNGRRIVGAQPYATFQAVIEEELNL